MAGEPVPDSVDDTADSHSDNAILARLLSSAAKGDRAAFRDLYQRTASILFSLCLRMVRERQQAEDLLQDVYVRIWQRAHQFDPAKGNALTWMIVITRYRIFDELRRRRRQGGDAAELGDDMEDQTAIDRLDSAADAISLKRCLGRLEEAPRRAILLAYFNGLGYEELSRILAAPSGTVKSWVSRGLERLRICMSAP